MWQSKACSDDGIVMDKETALSAVDSLAVFVTLFPTFLRCLYVRLRSALDLRTFTIFSQVAIAEPTAF